MTATSGTPGSLPNQYAETSRRLVTKAGEMMLHANSEISKGTYDFPQWARSANQLVNLALTAGLELAPPMIPFPCLPRATEEYGLSAYIPVKADQECERALSVAKSFVQAGAPSERIPDHFIVFDPEILPVSGTQFRVKVTWPDLRSGTYRGAIRLARLKSLDARGIEINVIVNL